VDLQRRDGLGELQRFEESSLVEPGTNGETTLECRGGADLRLQRDASATLRPYYARVRVGSARAYAYGHRISELGH
jgi:hypothetical protein